MIAAYFSAKWSQPWAIYERQGDPPTTSSCDYWELFFFNRRCQIASFGGHTTDREDTAGLGLPTPYNGINNWCSFLTSVHRDGHDLSIAVRSDLTAMDRSYCVRICTIAAHDFFYAQKIINKSPKAPTKERRPLQA